MLSSRVQAVVMCAGCHYVHIHTHTPAHHMPTRQWHCWLQQVPQRRMPTCVFEARSAMLPLAHSACWKAGCVLTKVVSPTALPTLLTAVSSRKCEGKRGVRNSQEMQTVYSTDVVKRKRCGQAAQDKQQAYILASQGQVQTKQRR